MGIFANWGPFGKHHFGEGTKGTNHLQGLFGGNIHSHVAIFFFWCVRVYVRFPLLYAKVSAVLLSKFLWSSRGLSSLAVVLQHPPCLSIVIFVMCWPKSLLERFVHSGSFRLVVDFAIA